MKVRTPAGAAAFRSTRRGDILTYARRTYVVVADYITTEENGRQYVWWSGGRKFAAVSSVEVLP